MAEFIRRNARQAGGNHGAPFPLRPRKFHGAYVTFTGIQRKLMRNLAQIVGRLGGVPQKTVTKLTTHVIAHRLTNQTYFEAFANRIPILKPDFILAVRDAPGDVDVRSAKFISSYSLKTFENVVACVSKCSKEVQMKIQKAIVAGGGHYSRNPQKNKTDVVIIPAAFGEKFQVARLWKILTVTPAWVLKSAAEGRLLPLNRFQPRLQLALTSMQIPRAGMQGPTISGISTIVQQVTSAAIIHSSHMSIPFRSLPALAEMMTQDGTCRILMKSTGISRILFVGLVFIVQLESESESRRISELIKDNGGELLLVVGEVEAGTIAILPPVYSARLPGEFLRASPSIGWKCQQKCLADSELSLHHRPIEVDENSGKFVSGFSVFIAGHSEPIKDYLGVLATHLGANAQESLNVESEPPRQLIKNDKCVGVARYSGLPIVTKD